MKENQIILMLSAREKEGIYSFEELYKEYYPQMHRSVCRYFADDNVHWQPNYQAVTDSFTGDKNLTYCMEADDVVQEIFLKIWKYWDSINWDDDVFCWIISVASSVAVDYKRAKRSERNYRAVEEKDPDSVLLYITDGVPSSDLCRALVAERRIEEVFKVVKTLGAKDQELFHLLYTKGMEPRDAAKHLDLSHGNMRIRLMRMRHRITTLIEEE